MKNEIVEFYKGKAVRKYNKIQIRVTQFEFKKFIDAKEKGISAKEALQNSTPCDPNNGGIFINFFRKR